VYKYTVGKKTGMILTVDNFVTVSGNMVCDMSKVSKFCPEIRIKLECH